MTRRIHRCLTCIPTEPTPESPFTQRRGYTRHADGVCSHCRRRGVRVVDGTVHVPFELRFFPKVATPAAPTFAEFMAGADLTRFLAWHGTDCSCPGCFADRKPGRYA